MRALWAIFGAPTVYAKTVIGSGSHSWDAIFHCGFNQSCAEEIYAYEVERAIEGRGITSRCHCGRLRALTPQQVSRMRREAEDDRDQHKEQDHGG